MNPETFSDRLNVLIGDKSLSSFARKCDIGESLLRQYKSGAMPRLDKLVKIAAAAGVDVNWLATGEGQRQQRSLDDYTFKTAERDLCPGWGYVSVPLYAVEASAGGGAWVESEQIVNYLSFKEDWLRNALGVSVKNLALINVIGDSMEPTVSDGDMVLLDTTSRSIQDSAIYVLQLGGTLLVKRIQHRLDGSVVVKSDNQHYDSEVVTGESINQLKIIGRVVWAGKKM